MSGRTGGLAVAQRLAGLCGAGLYHPAQCFAGLQWLSPVASCEPPALLRWRLEDSTATQPQFLSWAMHAEATRGALRFRVFRLLRRPGGGVLLGKGMHGEHKGGR